MGIKNFIINYENNIEIPIERGILFSLDQNNNLSNIQSIFLNIEDIDELLALRKCLLELYERFETDLSVDDSIILNSVSFIDENEALNQFENAAFFWIEDVNKFNLAHLVVSTTKLSITEISLLKNKLAFFLTTLSAA